MYITGIYGTIFNSKLKGSDKVTIKNLSVSEKKQDGTYANESWTARFVGKAKAVVDTLPEKTRVKITGNVHTGYDKEKKVNYPYVLVTVCEVLESKTSTASTTAAPAEDTAAKKDDVSDDIDW